VKLTFKLFASLTELLPQEARAHAIEIEVAHDVTALELIDRFRVPRQSAHLVLVNGVYLDPDNRGEANLRDGDTIAIWPPVAGG
jgi:molybdopterin converting factor small subunit